MTPILDETELDRIAAAVADAESRTAYEIICVVTREVSTYPETPLVVGIIVALILIPAAAALGLGLAALSPGGDWLVGHVAAAGVQLHRAMLDYALLQAAAFGLAAWLAAIPPVRRFLTPDRLKAARVKKAAQQQYQSARFADDGTGAGLVIFVSLHDRKVEIITDRATHQAVGETVWRGAVDAIRTKMAAGQAEEGLIDAVKICGAGLAGQFPAAGPRENTHTDRAIEL